MRPSLGISTEDGFERNSLARKSNATPGAAAPQGSPGGMVLPRQVFAFQAGSHTTEWSRSREQAYKIVSSEGFDVIIGIIIALNGAAIGLEMDMTSVPANIFDGLEVFFLCLFVLELGLKVFVFRTSFFKCVYHLLDVTIVLAGVAAMIMKVVQSQIDASVRNLQLLKLARLLRLVRILRIGTQFRSLWIIVHGLASCMSTICWTIVLVAIVCYIFAVIAVEFISSNTEIQAIRWDYQGSTVGERFADLRSALISLFEFFAIDKVSEKGFEVVKVQPWTIVFLLAFVLLIPIVLLNLVTAVIVEMAISAARKDEEHHRSVELEEWQSVCEELEALFAQMTTENDLPDEEEEDSATEEGVEANDTNQSSVGWVSRMRRGLRPHSGVQGKRNTLRKAVKQQVLRQDRLRDLCNNDVVREKLNLLFAEPAESKRGVEKLLEYWPMLDTNADGELSLNEFTEGIGRLHRVIKCHNGDGFFWVRLIKELKHAQEQREEQTHALQDAHASCSEYFKEAHRVFEVYQERHEIQHDMSQQLNSLTQTLEALTSAQLRTQERVDSIHQAMGLPPPPPRSPTKQFGQPVVWQCCSRCGEDVIDDDTLHM